MPKTQQEIDALKENWKQDPCWDIETTEGFEEHKDELLAFRLEWEANWKADADERIKLTFGYKAEQILDAVTVISPVTGESHSALAAEQVKATVLLAEQVAKLVDVLDKYPTQCA